MKLSSTCLTPLSGRCTLDAPKSPYLGCYLQGKWYADDSIGAFECIRRQKGDSSAFEDACRSPFPKNGTLWRWANSGHIGRCNRRPSTVIDGGSGWASAGGGRFVTRTVRYPGRVSKEDVRLSVVTALVRSTFLVNAVYAESAREHGLTSQQGQLLCVLMTQPYGMGELGAMLGLAKSSLTGLVDRSERNGLVRRVADPRDTRAVRVALTPRGSALVERFYDETCARVDKLAGGLGADERDVLAGLLGRVVLENKVPVVFAEPDGRLARVHRHPGCCRWH
jgi:DNA-binding MarR family transcriptional regulator